MTTYYLRRLSDGEIDNACETDGPVPQPMNPATHYYQAEHSVPRAVLQRYEFWDNRP